MRVAYNLAEYPAKAELMKPAPSLPNPADSLRGRVSSPLCSSLRYKPVRARKCYSTPSEVGELITQCVIVRIPGMFNYSSTGVGLAILVTHRLNSSWKELGPGGWLKPLSC